MDLVFTFSTPGALIRHTGGEEQVLSDRVDGMRTGEHTIGVFDWVTPLEDVTLSFEIKSCLKVEPSYDASEENLLADQGTEDDLTRTITTVLETGREYTYVELLQTVYKQQRSVLASTASDWLPGNSFRVWNQTVTVATAVHQNGVLLWPAFIEMIETGHAFEADKDGYLTGSLLSNEDMCRAVLKEIDFWMF